MQPNTAVSADIDLDLVVAAVERMIEQRRGGRTPAIGPDTRFDELGLTSLDFAETFVTIEELVGHELDPDSASDFTVVGDLVNLRPL